MVNNYETMFVVNPSVVTTDEELAPVMERFRQLVVDNGGEVLSISKWDKRRLAYEIAGQREGIYVLMFFKSEPSVQKELDRVFRISDEVIRHLIKRVEEKDIVEPPKPAAEEPAEVIEEVAFEEAPVEPVDAEFPEDAGAEELAEPVEAFEEPVFLDETETPEPFETAEAEETAVEAELDNDLAAEPEEKSGPSDEENES